MGSTLEQQREFLDVFSIKSDLLSFSLHWMPNILRELCTHPLLLKRVLEYWQREEKFPSKIEDLFRFWLDVLLCTDARDGVNSIDREAALTLLAKATTKTPINKVRAVALLREHGFSGATFDELLRCDAIQVSGSVIELQHEALADYLRVLDTVSFDEGAIAQSLLNVPLEIDSFFPILLMALLPSRTLQRNLWKRLAHVGLSLYLNSLRYRADVSGEMVKAKPDDMAFQYLQDLIEGLEFPLNGFFSQLKDIVTEQLIGTNNSEIAITGRVNPNPAQVEFAFHPLIETTEERVFVADPPEQFRTHWVNLELSSYRLDSGRLLGAIHLKESLFKLIEDRELKGGKIWASERLIGRLRYMAEEFDFPLDKIDSLDALEKLLRPDTEKIVFTGYPSRSAKFHIKALFEDIACLKNHGQNMLDPWWSRLGWENSVATSNSVIHQLLDEHFRRLQLAYKEIVENSFKSVSGEFGFYSALPVRWDLAVVRKEHGAVLHHRWFPVSSWDDIGADTEFSDVLPERFESFNFSEIDDALVKFGRTKCHSFRWGVGPMPSFDGYSLIGGFDGETTVVRSVCELISDDINRLFSALPSCD